MASDSYDVSKPEDGATTVKNPKRKTSKLIYILFFILLILVGIIVYLILFDDSCDDKQNIEKLVNPIHKGSTATKTTSTVKPRINKTTKLPNGKIDVKEKNICKSTQCLNSAADMLSSMDLSKEPCENFYEYACGNMDIPDRETLDIFAPQLFFGDDVPMFLLKFRSFYETCVNYEDRFDYEKRLNRTNDLLSRVGQFYDQRNKKDINITQLIANLILYDAMPLFDIDIDIDANNRYIMKLLMPDQTSLKFDHWSPLSETRRKCLRKTSDKTYTSRLNMTQLYNAFLLCQKNYADYLDLISTSVWEMKVWPNSTEDAMYKKLFDIRTFMEFEILSLFDQIPLPPNLHEQTIKRQFEEIKLGQLKREFPFLDWVYLFNVISNTVVTEDTKIQMYNREYFEDAFDQISRTPPDKLNDALLSILSSSLYINTVLPSHKHSRQKYCQEQSKELMPDIVNYLYKLITKEKDLNKQHDDLKIIYGVLEDTFKKALEKRNWLNNTEKAAMLKKLDKIQLVMFQNDDIESERDYLEDTYKGLEIFSDNHQYNQFTLLEFKTKKILSLHGKGFSKVDLYRNFVDASQEDPQYFYANDFVSVPYGLSKKCVDNLPAYMILAQVGFPLAKVIGEAFDGIGIDYGVNLTLESTVSYKYFQSWSRDIIIFTNPIKYGEKDLYFNLNNDLSESERISDNTAMRLMTDSFASFENQPLLPWISQQFSREKVFFLYLTQRLCRKMSITELMVEAFENPVLPPTFRVKSMLSNSQEFLKIFKCRPGSGMNPLKEHFQFPYLKKIVT